MLFRSGLVLLLSTLSLASSVLEANNKNFDDIVFNSGKNSVVEFYATWCSHCKSLEPTWKELADKYEKNKDVQIVKIECEKNRVLCSQFDIKGFPTIKLFKKDDLKNPVEFKGKRNTDSFVKFIGENVDTFIYTPTVQSKVVQVGDLDFDRKLLDSGKSVFVVFTASWCGHCKNLHPTWEQLANIYANDENVIIAEVSTTENVAEELKKRFKIRGFPTILTFKPNTVEPIEFASSRDIGGLVEWVNLNADTHRQVDGSLTLQAGRIPHIDEQVSKILSAGSDLAHDIATEVLSNLPEGSEYYRKLVNKFINGESQFYSKESARLRRLLKNSKNLTPQKIDNLQTRLNVLQVFLNPT